MQVCKKLRLMGGYSLMIVFPPEVKHRFGLGAGDDVLINIGEDLVTLTFPKTQQEELAEAS